MKQLIPATAFYYLLSLIKFIWAFFDAQVVKNCVLYTRINLIQEYEKTKTLEDDLPFWEKEGDSLPLFL
jgi:hypothetical protein